jgi:hypothetical protein
MGQDRGHKAASGQPMRGPGIWSSEVKELLKTA